MKKFPLALGVVLLSLATASAAFASGPVGRAAYLKILGSYPLAVY